MIDLKAKHPYRHAWEAVTDALDEVSSGWQQTTNPTTDAVNAVRRFKAEVVACKSGYGFWQSVEGALTDRLGPIWKAAGGNLGEAAALWVNRSIDCQGDLERENKDLIERIKELEGREASGPNRRAACYADGLIAFEAGTHDNPYAERTLSHVHWQAGWDQAKLEDDADIQTNDDRERHEEEIAQ